MAIGRMIVSSLPAFFLAALFSSPPYAESPEPPQSSKRVPATASDPFAAAQAQIERLRQTANKLRLLADQPIPSRRQGSARAEFAQHEQWLRAAEQRISVLANEWENQLRPLTEGNALARVADVNAFFESQSATLREKLRRESLAQSPASANVRSSQDTARLVIGTMY